MKKVEVFLKEWLSDRSGISTKEIDVENNMFEAGYVDSLGVFGLILELENEFHVEFSEEDMLDMRLSTVEGFIEIVEGKL